MPLIQPEDKANRQRTTKELLLKYSLYDDIISLVPSSNTSFVETKTYNKNKKEKTEEELEEDKRKAEYREEMFQKYNTTSWEVVKQKKKEEYEERCEKRKQREKEKAEWWEKNKDRIQADRERRHQDYIDRCAMRESRHREAVGKPIPGAWRTANREDGW